MQGLEHGPDNIYGIIHKYHMESDPFIGYIAYNIHMEQNLSESILCIYTYYINTDEMEHKYNPLNTIFYMGFVPSGKFTNIAWNTENHHFLAGK